MSVSNNHFEANRREALIKGVAGLVSLGAGAALLGGCASSAPTQTARRTDYGRRTTAVDRPRYRPTSPTYPSTPTGVIPRSAWAKGSPVPALMDTMLPVSRITVHHDGMDTFSSRGEGDAASRLEKIRQAHRSKNWGDIGYHYLVDPAGRVWEGRPLAWQGAHVANQNPGNLGICVMGNYEDQYPTDLQLETVERFVASQMRQYRVPVGRVFTHQELAATACPGRNLQPQLVAIRRPGGGLAVA